MTIILNCLEDLKASAFAVIICNQALNEIVSMRVVLLHPLLYFINNALSETIRVWKYTSGQILGEFVLISFFPVLCLLLMKLLCLSC